MRIVSRHANAQLKAGARHFTLETAYSCETGYPFDDLREIGNTSQFEKWNSFNLEMNNPPDFIRQL